MVLMKKGREPGTRDLTLETFASIDAVWQAGLSLASIWWKKYNLLMLCIMTHLKIFQTDAEVRLTRKACQTLHRVPRGRPPCWGRGEKWRRLCGGRT